MRLNAFYLPGPAVVSNEAFVLRVYRTFTQDIVVARSFVINIASCAVLVPPLLTSVNASFSNVCAAGTGRYRNETCEVCPSGYYSSGSGAQCTRCPDATYAVGTSAADHANSSSCGFTAARTDVSLFAPFAEAQAQCQVAGESLLQDPFAGGDLAEWLGVDPAQYPRVVTFSGDLIPALDISVDSGVFFPGPYAFALVHGDPPTYAVYSALENLAFRCEVYYNCRNTGYWNATACVTYSACLSYETAAPTNTSDRLCEQGASVLARFHGDAPQVVVQPESPVCSVQFAGDSCSGPVVQQRCVSGSVCVDMSSELCAECSGLVACVGMDTVSISIFNSTTTCTGNNISFEYAGSGCILGRFSVACSQTCFD